MEFELVRYSELLKCSQGEKRIYANSLVKSLDDVRIARKMLVIPFPYSASDAEWWFDHAATLECMFAIVHKGRIVGGVGVERGVDDRAMLGYWLSFDLWGRGVMTRVLSEFLELLGREKIYDIIYAETFATNESSKRVLKKAGFMFQGDVHDRYSFTESWRGFSRADASKFAFQF